MSEYLFTYGTLQPGLAPECIAEAVAKLQWIGEGSVAGALYDLGEYPGARPDAGSGSRIFGTVYLLPEDPEVLRQLDAYEEFYPEAPELSQFVRARCRVTMDDGSGADSWIYVYNWSLAGARVLEGGRFTRIKHGLR